MERAWFVNADGLQEELKDALRRSGGVASPEEVLQRVRTGKGAMPAFPEETIGDLALQHIYAWLRSLAPPTPTPAAAPSYPTGALQAMWQQVNDMKVSSDFAKDLPERLAGDDAEEEGNAYVDILVPEEKAPFKITLWEDVSGIDSYVVSVTGDEIVVKEAGVGVINGISVALVTALVLGLGLADLVNRFVFPIPPEVLEAFGESLALPEMGLLQLIFFSKALRQM